MQQKESAGATLPVSQTEVIFCGGQLQTGMRGAANIPIERCPYLCFLRAIADKSKGLTKNLTEPARILQDLTLSPALAFYYNTAKLEVLNGIFAGPR